MIWQRQNMRINEVSLLNLSLHLNLNFFSTSFTKASSDLIEIFHTCWFGEDEEQVFTWSTFEPTELLNQNPIQKFESHQYSIGIEQTTKVTEINLSISIFMKYSHIEYMLNTADTQQRPHHPPTSVTTPISIHVYLISRSQERLQQSEQNPKMTQYYLILNLYQFQWEADHRITVITRTKVV